MDELANEVLPQRNWPPTARNMYEPVEILGKGSFAMVWMARRIVPPQFEDDDEYVAIKNIKIKEEKNRIYCHREVSILAELNHPNIIRLIRSFPVFENSSRMVVMRLAPGPDLQQLVSKRGALGIPLSRLASRQLIAAVSYLHGRAVIHRDIKPTNCILEKTELRPQEVYDWTSDDAIWSDGSDAEAAVVQNKWKVILVDFGFARALTRHEISSQKKPMRQSIVNEGLAIANIARLVADELQNESDTDEIKETLRRESITTTKQHPANPMNKRRQMSVSIPTQMGAFIEETDEDEKDDEVPPSPARTSIRSSPKPLMKRQSSARVKLRAMSALGTKAYAAPEIKNDLRNKTKMDLTSFREALTECVADYGMIVDSYSVGWTLRVVMTGVPPTSTISEYQQKMKAAQSQVDMGCCFFGAKLVEDPPLDIKFRDVDELPSLAANLISHLTMKHAEDRMTIREAQSHPWIRGSKGEETYHLPEGDTPSRHGDPVFPLKCAGSLPLE